MKYLISCLAVLLFASPVFAQTKSAVHTAAKPVFAARTMTGRVVDTAALRGKVVVLNLWFINCPNCVHEIKELNQLVDAYKDNKDVVFLGLAASRKDDLEKFLVKNPFKYEVIPNASMIILGKFGSPDKSGEINIPFPMHYVLDREGSVIVKAQGTAGIGFVKNELKRQFPPQTEAAN